MVSTSEKATAKCGLHIKIDIGRQTLELIEKEKQLYLYPVSTAINGTGEEEGSGCTPRGHHHIRAKIGAELPENSVFRARRPTGEIYTSELAKAYPGRDWILTRILWLSGNETGFNRGGRQDTLRRFIYIHGCPETEPMGIAKSHGCIRMRNDDLLTLFERVPVGTPVDIRESFD